MTIQVLSRLMRSGLRLKYCGNNGPMINEYGRCWEIWSGGTFFMLIWEDELLFTKRSRFAVTI